MPEPAPERDEHGPLSRSRLRREAIVTGRTPPDDTTEGLRERVARALAPSGWLRDDGLQATVDAVLAALATDPGNLPARMAEVIASHEWDDFPRSAHNQHNYYGACAVCQRDILRMAEVALGVRDELVAHLSARAAAAEARVEHAEAGAELSSERLAEVRQELAEAYNLSNIRAKLLREAWDAHHDTMDELDSLRRKLTAKEAEADGLNRDRDGWRTRANEAEAKLHEIAMVKVWTNEDGKRFVFADDLSGILLDMPVEGTTTPARETA